MKNSVPLLLTFTCVLGCNAGEDSPGPVSTAGSGGACVSHPAVGVCHEFVGIHAPSEVLCIASNGEFSENDTCDVSGADYFGMCALHVDTQVEYAVFYYASDLIGTAAQAKADCLSGDSDFHPGGAGTWME